MTRRVPLSKCNHCPHYDGRICLLPDLEPCHLSSDDERAVNRFLTVVTVICAATIVGICILMYASCAVHKEEVSDVEVSTVSTCALLRQAHCAELSEWQSLQMALMLTESRFNADAVGAAQDRGVLQIVPVYVAEVNRLAGTNYTPADAHDIDKALAMFDVIQAHYNPSCDRDTAIYYHNKGTAYRRAVLSNLAFIRRYENARKHLIR